MFSAAQIIYAMADVRPGRFYSVDEIASTLGATNKPALHDQLRVMAGRLDIHHPHKIRQSASDEFYRRSPFAPILTLDQR